MSPCRSSLSAEGETQYVPVPTQEPLTACGSLGGPACADKKFATTRGSPSLQKHSTRSPDAPWVILKVLVAGISRASGELRGVVVDMIPDILIVKVGGARVT